MIRLSLYLFLWIASMAIAIFATQNTYLVSVRLFNFESIKIPLGLLLICCTGLGAVFVNLWQTSISSELPTVPNFSGDSTRNAPQKQQSATTSTPKPDTSRTTKKFNDDFDDEWDEEWK